MYEHTHGKESGRSQGTEFNPVGHTASLNNSISGRHFQMINLSFVRSSPLRLDGLVFSLLGSPTLQNKHNLPKIWTIGKAHWYTLSLIQTVHSHHWYRLCTVITLISEQNNKQINIWTYCVRNLLSINSKYEHFNLSSLFNMLETLLCLGKTPTP